MAVWMAVWMAFWHFFSKNLMIEELPNPNQSTKPLCFNLWAMGLRSWQLAIVLAQKLGRCSPPRPRNSTSTHHNTSVPVPSSSCAFKVQDVAGTARNTTAPFSFHHPICQGSFTKKQKLSAFFSACRSPRLPHTPHISPYSHVLDQDGSGVIHDHPCQYYQSGL